MDKNASAKIALDYPIEFDGQTIAEFTMRRPKVRDNLKASKIKGNDLERGLSLMSDLCDQPVEVFHELDEVDLNKVSAQYTAFTGRKAETEED